MGKIFKLFEKNYIFYTERFKIHLFLIISLIYIKSLIIKKKKNIYKVNKN
jgi:hypothetical protein